MVEGVNVLGTELINFYREFLSFFPPYVGSFLNFIVLVLLVVVYSVLIWRFYRFISKKNPLGLNLNRLINRETSFFTKGFSGFFYFLEYIIISPFLIMLIFAAFTLLLIFLTQAQDVSQLLTISAVIIAAIRMTSYYKENLSQELAKMLPFTLLAVSVLNPATFTQSEYVINIINHFSQLPSLIGNIWYYLVFIIGLEIVLRFFDYVFSLFGLEEFDEEKEE